MLGHQKIKDRRNTHDSLEIWANRGGPKRGGGVGQTLPLQLKIRNNDVLALSINTFL